MISRSRGSFTTSAAALAESHLPYPLSWKRRFRRSQRDRIALGDLRGRHFAGGFQHRIGHRAAPARAADRPVTDAERVKLEAAVRDQGCSVGKMEFDEDDRQFEVDDAVCDGRKFDLKFDADFKFLRKNPD